MRRLLFCVCAIAVIFFAAVLVTPSASAKSVQIKITTGLTECPNERPMRASILNESTDEIQHLAWSIRPAKSLDGTEDRVFHTRQIPPRAMLHVCLPGPSFPDSATVVNVTVLSVE